MSVTFSVYKDQKFVSPNGWVAEYEEDPIYGKIQTNQNPLEMNVANGNFGRIMELLGFENEDYCGTWKKERLERVQEQITFVLSSIAAMPLLDNGKESITEGNFTDCGLRAGYFTERLTQLLVIVNTALEIDGVVTFG